jgi:hypothetical protein
LAAAAVAAEVVAAEAAAELPQLQQRLVDWLPQTRPAAELAAAVVVAAAAEAEPLARRRSL